MSSARGFGWVRRWLLRLLRWLLPGIVIILLVTYAVLPAVLGWVVPHSLARIGVPATIDSVRVRPFEESVTLTGLVIGPPEGASIRWEEVTARVDLNALFTGRLTIRRFTLKGATLDVGAGTGWLDGLAVQAEGDAAPVDVDEVLAEDLTLLMLPDERPVRISRLFVESVNDLMSDEGTALELEFSIGTGTLNLSTRGKFVDGRLEIGGKFESAGLSVDGLHGFVDGFSDIDGIVRGGGKLSLHYDTATGAGEFAVDSDLVFADVALTGAAFGLEFGDAGSIGTTVLIVPEGDDTIRTEARGALRAESAAFESEAAGAYRLRGLEWTGSGVAGDRLDAAGRLRVSGLSSEPTEGAGPEAHPAVEIDALGAESVKFESDGSAPPRVSANGVEIDSLSVGSGDASGRRLLVAERTRIGEVGLAGGTIAVDGGAIGRLSVESQAGSGESRWVAEAFEVGAVEFDPGVRWRLGRVAAGRLAGGSETLRVTGDGLTARAVSHSEEGIGLDALAATRIQVELGGRVTRGETVSLAGVLVDGAGKTSVAEVGAELVGFADAEQQWDVRDLAGKGLVVDAADVAASSLAVASISGNAPWAESLRAAEAAIERGAFRSGEITAERARVAELSLVEGDIRLELRRLASQSLRASAKAGRVGQSELDRLEVVDSRLATWRTERVKLAELAWSDVGTLAVPFVEAASLSFEDAEEVSLRIESIRVTDVRREVDNAIEFGSARTAALALAVGSGVKSSASDVEFGAGRWADGNLVIEQAGAAKIRHQAPNWNVGLEGVRTEPLTVSDEGVRTAARVSASRLDGNVGGELDWKASNAKGREVKVAADLSLDLGFVQLQEIDITSSVNEARLAVDRVDLQGVTSKKGLFGVTQVRLDSAAINDDTGPDNGWARLDRVQVRALKARETSVSAESVDVSSVRGALGIDGEGQWRLPALPLLSGKGSVVRVAIDRVRTLGAESEFRFFDYTTTPAFESPLVITRARLEGLDTGAPGSEAEFSVAGTRGEFTTIEADGVVIPRFDSAPDLRLEARLRGLELERLSPYTSTHLGSAVAAGRGDATLVLRVEDSTLVGESELVLSGVKTKTTAADGASGATPSSGTIPLGAALSMLEDKDGVVRIPVPISGKVDDPQFDFSAIFAQAVAKAVQGAVMLVFQPVGILSTATGLLGGIGVLQAKPIEFDPGSAKIPAIGLTRLDVLAKELDEHPKTRVRVCGKAVPVDAGSPKAGEPSQPAAETPPASKADPLTIARLTRLASERAQSVSLYLTGHHGIGGGRVVQCEPELSDEAGAPRAEIVLELGDGTAATTPPARGGAKE